MCCGGMWEDCSVERVKGTGAVLRVGERGGEAHASSAEKWERVIAEEGGGERMAENGARTCVFATACQCRKQHAEIEARKTKKN